jgi:CheY-like chemotaxis protein
MALASRLDSQPLLVVAHDDAGTADGLRHAVETAGWRVAVAQPGAAGLAAALTARPAVALVGCALLRDLPAGSGVPVLAVGDDTRPADLRAALDAGAAGLVTWPDGAADLAAELARAAAAGTEADEATTPIVAVHGVQGGSGATTVAVHLAVAWARWGPTPVLAADLAGGLAFRLDLVVGAWTWADLAQAATGLDPPCFAPLHGSSTFVNDLGSRSLPAGGPRLVQRTAGAGFPFRHHLPTEAGLLVGSTGVLSLRATPGDQVVDECCQVVGCV